jgi:hypothetical protein
VALTQLTLAYVRRKRFEAQLVAVQVGQLFAGKPAAQQSGYQAARAVMGELGIDW